MGIASVIRLCASLLNFRLLSFLKHSRKRNVAQADESQQDVKALRGKGFGVEWANFWHLRPAGTTRTG
jgi:hypothetical protein